jgi:lipopolysaccharide export system permease protein
MYNIVNKYIIIKFLKIILNAILIFLSLGILLNLFEEIEFFKNLNQSISLPIILSLAYVPTLIIELLPFIIFYSSMYYFIQIRSSKDLLLIKVFGYSNVKIISIVAFVAFLFGGFVLLAINPITSTLTKYYENERATYSIDIDHLISINKNGLWIKEIDENGYKIINAEKFEMEEVKKISVYIFNDKHELLKRIEAESAIITNNPWLMNNVRIYDFKKNNTINTIKNYNFETEKVADKINSLYSNLNTISFFNLITNYSLLNEKGYSKKILNEKINKFVSLPFFLLLMVVLASLFTIGSLKVKQNFYYVIVSILTSVMIYYFKDLSFALGQTEKISLGLSVWMPVIALGLFCTIGVIQINEK